MDRTPFMFKWFMDDSQGSGMHPLRQSSPHPHAIHGDPVSDLIYVCDLGIDAVVQYKGPSINAVSNCGSPRGEGKGYKLYSAYFASIIRKISQNK